MRSLPLVWLAGVLAVVAMACQTSDRSAGSTNEIATSTIEVDASYPLATRATKTAPSGPTSTPTVPLATLSVVPMPPNTGSLGLGEMLFDADGNGSFGIYVYDRATGQRRRLTDDPGTDEWWARPSPDRTRILFYRTPVGTHDLDYTKTTLWMMNADGSNQIELLGSGANGWEQHGHAEWSPAGDRLVMFAGSRINPQIWVTDAEGRNPAALTDDGGTNVDPSWSPDGSMVVYVGCPSMFCLPGSQELYLLAAGGGERRRLTEDRVRDQDPYYSPDGQTIAFLSQTKAARAGDPFGEWNIRAVPTGGGEVRSITNEAGVTSLPRWSADGQIFTHRLEPGGTGFDLWQFDPGTGKGRALTRSPANEEYPSP